MRNLEERLKAISKVEVSETAVLMAKDRILSKTKKKRFEITPILVTGLMFAIMCMLIFMPTSQTTDRATSLFTDEIKEVQFLQNTRPNINHRVDSFNYSVLRNTLDKQQQIEDFKVVLHAAQKNVKPWTEKIDDYSIGELAVVMEGGEVYYLKYNSYDEAEDAAVIYDLKNKVKYIAEFNEDTIAFNTHLYDERSLSDFGLLFGLIAVGAIMISCVSHFYRKKYAILDERGKAKRLKGWAHYIPYFLFVFPLFIMTHLIGTLHIGFFLILIFLHSLITSQLEMKQGIVRPNNIHFKFLLPFYTLCVISALILILVV